MDFPLGVGAWEGVKSVDVCSEMLLEKFSAQDVAYRSIFEHFQSFFDFANKFRWLAVLHGIDHISCHVGQVSFTPVVWADPNSCALKNDEDSWCNCVEISVFSYPLWPNQMSDFRVIPVHFVQCYVCSWSSLFAHVLLKLSHLP